jgi:hypothetical protein
MTLPFALTKFNSLSLAMPHTSSAAGTACAVRVNRSGKITFVVIDISYFCRTKLGLIDWIWFRTFKTTAQLSFKRKSYFEVLCRSRIDVRWFGGAAMVGK